MGSGIVPFYKDMTVVHEIWLEMGGLFISSFISSTLAPGGSEAVLAYMVSEKSQQAVFLVLIATLGNTLGAFTTWGLGGMAAKKAPLPSLLSEKHRQALAIVRRRGAWILLFSWLPVIGDAFCFAGGWLRMPLLSGGLAIFLGKLGRYAAIAWLLV
jgi:membrane protein YqaA with SNARE-associated domain